jgi:hypothetical protein
MFWGGSWKMFGDRGPRSGCSAGQVTSVTANKFPTTPYTLTFVSWNLSVRLDEPLFSSSLARVLECLFVREGIRVSRTTADADADADADAFISLSNF